MLSRGRESETVGRGRGYRPGLHCSLPHTHVYVIKGCHWDLYFSPTHSHFSTFSLSRSGKQTLHLPLLVYLRVSLINTHTRRANAIAVQFQVQREREKRRKRKNNSRKLWTPALTPRRAAKAGTKQLKRWNVFRFTLTHCWERAKSSPDNRNNLQCQERFPHILGNRNGSWIPKRMPQ